MSMIERDIRAGVSRLTGALIVRGVIAILFGIVLLIWPGISLRTLVLVFGAYSFADGVVALVSAWMSQRREDRLWMVLHGLAGIAAGMVAFVWTDLSALALLYVIGTWAIVLGSIELVSALSGTGPAGDRFTAGVHGVLGLAFGAVMWWRPGAGALVLITLIATFAIVTGVMRIAAAMQIRNRSEDAASALFPPSAEIRA